MIESTENWQAVVLGQMARQDVSFAELARRLRVSTQAVHKQVTVQENSPRLETMIRYAKALGCRVELKLKPVRN